MAELPLIIFLLYALYAGLIHAFEADHILAVTNIVSQRTNLLSAVKDGIFWGLGHTSTIFLVGVIMIVFKVNIPAGAFSYFEAAVGVMLILVASYRLYIFLRDEQTFISFHRHQHEHAGENKHLHTHIHLKGKNLHKASYGIGIVHGLAGSGTLVVLIMTQIESIADSILYLVIFGLGTMVGMTLVAGIFSVPFTKKLVDSKVIRTILVLVSSGLCLIYGCYVIYANLAG